MGETERIKRLVAYYVRHFGTTDPFEIAAAAEIREQIAGDGTEKIIISGLLNRSNLTEIAEQLKISKQAVSKRLAKIRNRAATDKHGVDEN